MKRKVNKVGQNTLTVSLPRKWVEENGIVKGYELDLEIEGKTLQILAGQPGEHNIKEAAIAISDSEKTVVRSILGAYYQKGYDLIRVSFKDASVFASIKNAVAQLIGFEIMEKSEGSCIIKSFLADSEQNMPDALSKLLNIIKSLHTLVKEDYAAAKIDRFEDVEQYRFAGWKLRDLSTRLINKNKLGEFGSQENTLILWSLEKINRNYRRIYRQLMRKKKFKPIPDLIGYFDKVLEMFGFFCKCLNDGNLRLIEEVYARHDELTLCGLELIEKGGFDAIIATYLLENVRRMQDMASPLVMRYVSKNELQH